jgi:HD-like signal output (HDOD) protein
MYDITDLLNNIKEFPAMPNVIMQALNIIKNPASGAKELAKIITYDQSLSIKILTLVNSAYYGLPQQITSISRAIALIGITKAKNLILTVAMKPMLVNQGDKELWQHSMYTAVGCEYVARVYKIMEPDEAFVVGFLHDIGKVALNLKNSKLYERVKLLLDENTNILELERTHFGVDHCQLGSLLTKRWQLSLLINNVVKYHHSPNASSMPTVCSLVYFVNALVKDNFDADTLEQDIIKNLNIPIFNFHVIKDDIIAKTEILLRELSK